MVAAAAAPSVSLGAPRTPARHCGAPATAAQLGAAEALGPLCQARRLRSGETRLCFQGVDEMGWDAPQGRGEGSWAGRNEDQLARMSGSPCWHQAGYGQRTHPQGFRAGLLKLGGGPDFLQHLYLIIGAHKTQHWRVEGERNVKDLVLWPVHKSVIPITSV